MFLEVISGKLLLRIWWFMITSSWAMAHLLTSTKERWSVSKQRKIIITLVIRNQTSNLNRICPNPFIEDFFFLKWMAWLMKFRVSRQNPSADGESRPRSGIRVGEAERSGSRCETSSGTRRRAKSPRLFPWDRIHEATGLSHAYHQVERHNSWISALRRFWNPKFS